MSVCPHKGCPPVPNGAKGVQDHGSPSNTGNIVPFGAPVSEKRPVLPAFVGLLLCALGGAVSSSTFSVVSTALVGYGFSVASARGGLRDKGVAALVTLVPALALSLPQGVASAVGAVIVCLAALAVAGLLMGKRMTPGVACLAVAILAVCHLGLDALAALAQATTLTDSVKELLDAYEQQLVAASSDVALQIRAVRTLLDLLWPTTYVIAALGEFLFARLGVWLAAEHEEALALKMPRFVDYDLPLWMVALLVADVAALAVELSAPTLLPRGILMVAANLVMALRFAFAAQGAAVLVWFIRGKHLSNPIALLLGALALYLEMQFVVLTIAGLVDVWANFRHLQRDKKADDVPGAAEQD